MDEISIFIHEKSHRTFTQTIAHFTDELIHLKIRMKHMNRDRERVIERENITQFISFYILFH